MNMNIAICLFDNGSDKNIENLLYPMVNKFHLFAHSYSKFNSNGYTSTIIDDPYIIKNDEYYTDLNVKNIPNSLTEINAVHNRPGKYTDITNSMMKVNNLKKQYELAHNMIFDIVVNINFNIDYPYKLFDFIATIDIDNYPNSVFGDYKLDYSDYKTPRFNTDCCFGSSLTMDIINNFHRYYYNGMLYQILKANRMCTWSKLN